MDQLLLLELAVATAETVLIKYLLDIEYKKAIISKYSIDEILKQGYTLTRKNGKVVRSGKGLQKGDIIQTRFIDGEVESIIQE